METPTSNEKHNGVQETVTRPVDSKDVDRAYTFLANAHQDEAAETLNMAAIRRKVDWRIVPIMFLIYLMNLIDKVALNYAAVMGMPKDLRLQGNDFTNTATIFFAAYLIAEIPTVYILNKVPAGKYLAVNVVLWGIATACCAAAKDYSSLVAARIFLGIFEAPVAPCLMLINSQWYTKPEQSPRFAFWYCGLGAGQIIGGILSFAFQHIDNPGFEGWRVMWVVLGCVTIVLGFVTFWILPDSPTTAKFLSDAEKAALLHHIAENRTGVMNTTFHASHLIESLKDPQMYLLALMTILPSISSGVVTSYSATLISNFGYTPMISALLNCPGGAVSIISTLTVGLLVQKTSNRWLWYIGCCIPGIIGGGLLGFLPTTNQGGLLVGIYMVNFVVPTVLVCYQFAAINTAGSTKRAFSTTLIAFSFGIGNILGPQTFQARDAPQFIPAKITVLATQAAAACLAGVLFLYYRWSNARRSRLDIIETSGSDSDGEMTKWGNMTDKENKAFRYTY